MPPVFPNVNLGIKVELLLNSVWTDVTAYVYQRNAIQITNVGRADFTSIQAASMTLTLNNRDGRFTPKNTSGAYTPYIARNVQIRVSVNSQSVTGVVYSGFRFWGEVSEWPPAWNPNSRDIYTNITAAGIWRRVSQQQQTLGSAYTRYNTLTLTGGNAPRSYWPCEDGTGSGQLVDYGSSAVTTANAVQSFVTGQAGLSLAACTDFKGSDGIPQLNAAKILATVPAGGTATNNVTRFLLSVPKAGDSASGTTNWNVIEVASAGTVAKFEIYLNFAGTLAMNLRNSGGTIIASGTTTTNVQGMPVLCSCELTPSGGNVAFAFRIITPGAAGITESMTGTLTTASVGAITTVSFNRANVLMDTAVGHIFVSYAAPTSMVSAAYALNGYIGEFAMDRFTRICAEMGITSETIATASATAAMGPQMDDHLADVFQTIENTDCGLLFESRGQFGLGYRSLTSMSNQAAVATISYTSAVLDQGLALSFDDLTTWNNITVSNYTGYTQQAILTAGAMSVLNPPSGIGNGYGFTRSVSTAADSQVAGIATFLLNVGAVDEVRFTAVPFKLVRVQDAALFSLIPSMRIGDYFQITNMPAHGGPSTAKQLVWGYSETLNADEWTFNFNTMPESPYETGFTPGTTQIAQIPGGGATTSTAPGAGGLGGVIANGSITPAMLSQGIVLRTIEGGIVTISAGAPTAPNTGDIWIASATGLISSWNGSSWVPQTFDGHTVINAGTITTTEILAGTIVASDIATGTLTAALMAAGIAVIGIVDATTVQAAQYIANGTSGQFLAYSGAPATGNLNASISGYAGTDTHSNSFPIGLLAQALTLQNQSSAPPQMSGADVFYSAGGGRPRFISSSGDNSVLERSAINVASFSVGNTTSPTAISAPLNYLASEGNQSSEYEIEILGVLTWPATGAVQWKMQLYIDTLPANGVGSTVSQFTSGLGLNTANGTNGYRIVTTLYLTNGGAGGTAQIGVGGYLWDVTPVRSPATSQVVGAQSGNFNFDATVNHTLQMAAWWTAGGMTGSPAFATSRTRLTRRM